MVEGNEMTVAKRALALADTFGHVPLEQAHSEAIATLKELSELPHSHTWFIIRAVCDWIVLMASSGSHARAKFEIYAMDAAERLRVLVHDKEFIT